MERLLTLYSEVQSTDVRWLWYPFIAIGKITLLQGDPGDGKSTMMMNLIAELSTGGKTPDGCKIGVPQKVIYQCSEDGVSDTIKPRLERCGADCRKIAFINEEVYNGLTLPLCDPPWAYCCFIKRKVRRNMKKYKIAVAGTGYVGLSLSVLPCH